MAKHHDLQTRAAVMAALWGGQGTLRVAKAYSLPPSTVSRWKAEARKEAGRSDDVGILLFAYLTENLKTLRAQVVAFRDPAWLKKQSASELGVMHGILADKSVRLLEALQGGPVEKGC